MPRNSIQFGFAATGAAAANREKPSDSSGGRAINSVNQNKPGVRPGRQED